MRRLFLIPWLIIGTVAQQKILDDLGISFHNFLNGYRQTNGGLIFGDLRPQPEGTHPNMPVIPVMQPIPSGLEILHPPSKTAPSAVNFFTIPPMHQQHEIKFVDLFHKEPSPTPGTEPPPSAPPDVQVEPPLPPAEPSEEPQPSPERLAKIIPKALTTVIKNATAGKEPLAETREIPNRGGFNSNLDASRHASDSADVDVFEIPIKTETVEESVAEKPKEIVDETTSAITTNPTTVIPTTSPSTISSTVSSTISSTSPSTAETEAISSTTPTIDNDFEHFLQSTNLTEQEADVLLRIVEKALDEEVNKKFAEDRNKLSGIKIHEEKEDIQSSVDDDTLLSSKGVDSDNLPPQKHFHQLKTAETRLNINLKEVEESSSEHPTFFTPSTTKQSSQHQNTVFNGADDGDYRRREQAEFDRLVKGQFAVVATTSVPLTSPPTLKNENVVRVQQTPRPRTTTTTTQSPVLPFRSIHHAGPPTEFEKLASDYRVRLSGHNGINDFIKALRNAHIGFFERPTYNRYKSPIES